MIDQVILEEASILTVIGIGTAFGLLLLLMVVVVVVRLFSGVILEGVARRAARAETESRDRARAAVAAVTAIMATRTSSGATVSGRD